MCYLDDPRGIKMKINSILLFSILCSSTVVFAEELNILPTKTASETRPNTELNKVEEFEAAKEIAVEPSQMASESVSDIIVPLPPEKTKTVKKELKTTPVVKTKKMNNLYESIKVSIFNQIEDLKYCYQTELDESKTPAKISGLINLKLKIKKSGELETLTCDRLEFVSPKLGDCFKKAISSIKFPQSSDGLSINQPLNLKALKL
jgi:hypothetical protein